MARRHAIVARGLTKVFREKTAVDGLSFRVARGRFFGFLGPERRGQEHDDQDAHGPAAADLGRRRHRGRAPLSRTCSAIKGLIGVLPEELPLYERLTGEEYLHFAGRMYGLPRAEVRRRSDELLEFLSLAGRPRQAARRLLAGDEEEGRPGRGPHPQPAGAVPRRALERHRPDLGPRGDRPAPAHGPEGRHAVLHDPRPRRRRAAVRRGGDHRPWADRGPGHARRDPGAARRWGGARAWRTCS